MKLSYKIILLCLFAGLTNSCHRSPYHRLDTLKGVNLQFLFDWNGYNDIPPGMNLIFYPIHDNNSTEDDYTGVPITAQLQYDGGEVSLPAGRYNVAIYNDYTYSILYRNMEQFHTAEGYLEEYNRQPLASRSAPSRNVAEPDIFYVAQLNELTVTAKDNNRTITIYPELATLTLFVHVEAQGIVNISMADGGIYGVAGSVMLSTGTSPDEAPANRLFPLDIKTEELYTKTKVFLLKNKLSCTYMLELAFLLRNNTISMGKYKYDITEQIRKPLEENNGRIPPEGIHIWIRDIVIEDVGASGGFDAVVDQWGEEINIELQ